MPVYAKYPIVLLIYSGNVLSTVNLLWPSDATWRHRSASASALVMACNLMALRHYLNQWWHIIRGVLWHSPCSIFRRIGNELILHHLFKDYTLWITTSPPRSQWVITMWPSDAIWQHRSVSTLSQVMVCFMTAPSHYPNQCCPLPYSHYSLGLTMAVPGLFWTEIVRPRMDPIQGPNFVFLYTGQVQVHAVSAYRVCLGFKNHRQPIRGSHTGPTWPYIMPIQDLWCVKHLACPESCHTASMWDPYCLWATKYVYDHS